MILRKLIASVMAATMALTPSVAVFAQTHQEPLNLNLPSMGSVAGTDLSPLEEQMLGEEIMSQIRADDAYLNDASLAMETFGYPTVPVKTLIRWQAQYILDGGRTLDKPTHFEERKGSY